MTLTLACGDYDRTRRLLDATITIADHKLKLMTMPPEDMFRRAFETAEFDISELSISTFLLPYEPWDVRVHRHSGVSVTRIPPLRHLRTL